MFIIAPLALVLLLVTGRAILLYFKPYIECPWCRNRKKCRLKQRGCLIHPRRCWRCKNTRLARRLGAYHVHKVKLSLLQAWAERGSDE